MNTPDNRWGVLVCVLPESTMIEPTEFSFAIMNGQCRLASDAIYFDYSQSWKLFCRFFGQPSRRRSVVIALVLGLPLILFAITLAVFEQWHFATYPLFWGVLLVVGSIATFFYEEHSYPGRIPLSAIQDVVSYPPAGMFTIIFESDGRIQKTAFCIRCANWRRRAESHQAISDVFASAGLIR